MKGRGSWVWIGRCPLNQTRQKKTCLMMPISKPCQMVERIWSYHIPCSLWSPHLVSPPFRLSWLQPTPCPADTKLSRTHKSMKRCWIRIPHRSTEWQPVDDDKHHCTMGMNLWGPCTDWGQRLSFVTLSTICFPNHTFPMTFKLSRLMMLGIALKRFRKSPTCSCKVEIKNQEYDNLKQ